MQYITNNLNYKIEEPTVITLGKFDGLHRGHELLMENLFARSSEKGYKTMVFTFDIPPRQQVDEVDTRVLTTNEEKRYVFEKTGVDYLFECPFTPAIMCMEPEAFIRWIVDSFCVRCVVVGKDFRFGHKRAGDYHTLQKYATKYGYEVVVLEKIREDGRDISSTFVREEIVKGNLEKANRLLGYPFFVKSEVIHGKELGRTIGTPTINMEFPSQKLLPPNGVYVSRVHIDDASYCGVTNVGCKPTVTDSGRIGVETHILDFAGDLYGRELPVEFLHFIRPEMKFASLEELRSQMEGDIRNTQRYYKNITK